MVNLILVSRRYCAAYGTLVTFKDYQAINEGFTIDHLSISPCRRTPDMRVVLLRHAHGLIQIHA